MSGIGSTTCRKGGGPALSDLIGGGVQALFSIAAAILQVKAGRIRALAIPAPDAALAPGRRPSRSPASGFRGRRLVGWLRRRTWLRSSCA